MIYIEGSSKVVSPIFIKGKCSSFIESTLYSFGAMKMSLIFLVFIEAQIP